MKIFQTPNPIEVLPNQQSTDLIMTESDWAIYDSANEVQPPNSDVQNKVNTIHKDQRAQLIAKAKKAGYQRANIGAARPTIEDVERRHPNYTDKLIRAYYEGFDKKSAKIKALAALSHNANNKKNDQQDYAPAQAENSDQMKQLISRARRAGYQGAYKKYFRPTLAELKKSYPLYIPEQIEAYYDSFDKKIARDAAKEQQPNEFSLNADVAPSLNPSDENNDQQENSLVQEYDLDVSLLQYAEDLFPFDLQNEFEFPYQPLLLFSSDITADKYTNEPVPPLVEEPDNPVEYTFIGLNRMR